MVASSNADQRGITLVEVLVASVLGLLVMTMGYTILNTSTKTASTVASRAVNSTNARQAVTLLEANLRYADGVWLCSTTATSATPCPAATSAATTMLSVSNATASPNAPASTNISQPGCAHWTIASTGLVETSWPSGAPADATVGSPGSTARVTAAIAGATAYNAGAGFSLPLPNLVEINLQVNGEPTRTRVAADAVTIHDLVAPNNLADTQTVKTACF